MATVCSKHTPYVSQRQYHGKRPLHKCIFFHPKKCAHAQRQHKNICTVPAYSSLTQNLNNLVNINRIILVNSRQSICSLTRCRTSSTHKTAWQTSCLSPWEYPATILQWPSPPTVLQVQQHMSQQCLDSQRSTKPLLRSDPPLAPTCLVHDALHTTTKRLH